MAEVCKRCGDMTWEKWYGDMDVHPCLCPCHDDPEPTVSEEDQ